MAKLIIYRTSEWNNRMRDIGVYLDGTKIGVIENGQTKEFEIESGKHKLKAKIDWCGSEVFTFELNDEDTEEVELSGFKLGKWLIPLTLIISALYFALGELMNFDTTIFLILILPFGIYSIYHLTLGRNKYLRLKEK